MNMQPIKYLRNRFLCCTLPCLILPDPSQPDNGFTLSHAEVGL